MKNTLGELHPSRSVARRMYELEAELQRARMHRRRDRKNPENIGRWGLDSPATAQQEEGWFITYLDMMTLLLVVMIVMLAFSGSLGDDAGASSQATDISAEKDTASSPMATSGVGAETAVGAHSQSTPAAPHFHETEEAEKTATMGGNGLLPGGPGLFPGQSTVAATPVAEAASPLTSEGGTASPPADAGQVTETLPGPTGVASVAELYPGWSHADLAASFIGPRRPLLAALTAPAAPALADASPAAPSQTPGLAESTPAPSPTASATHTEDDPPTVGETLAAGLSLGELGGDVEVVVNERSVSFRVNSEILFDTSQADLSRSGLSVLRRIVSVLSKAGHEVTVEGHTDSVPVRRNVRYPSNWELSSARAGSVVRYLQANGIAKNRLKAIGYADTRPIGDNHTPDGRARNRRVELVIEGTGTAQ